jgi:hypothetical protein
MLTAIVGGDTYGTCPSALIFRIYAFRGIRRRFLEPIVESGVSLAFILG